MNKRTNRHCAFNNIHSETSKGDTDIKINCLSDDKFGNLLFVNVLIDGVDTVALFDTGAAMSVVTKSLLEKLGKNEENEHLKAGNNSGKIQSLPTVAVSNVQIGDIVIDTLKTVVVKDEDLEFCDEQGCAFPAKMLLGWDVISRFAWRYCAKDKTLSVEKTNRLPILEDLTIEPLVFSKYCNKTFKAKVDTGHTESILGKVWLDRLPYIEYRESETIGVGSTVRNITPYVKTVPITFGNHTIELHDADICEKIYGQADDIEALLGYDFLQNHDWRLNGEFELV